MVKEPYEAYREQRREIRDLTSQLIGRFARAIRLRMPTAADDGCVKIEPNALDDLVEQDGVSIARKASDCIASLTEAETMAMHARLHGYSVGSVLDPTVR